MSIFSKIFKKGGIIGKALSGLGNVVVSKVTGGAVTNLFKTTKAVTPEQKRVESNAQAVIASAGAAAGVFKAQYTPSATALASEQAAATAPFSAVNVSSNLEANGTKSFLAQYWQPIAIVFAVVITFIILILKPSRR